MLQQQHLVLVKRSFNPNWIVKGFGKTPEEAARKVFSRAGEYSYWDATKTYPQAKNPLASSPKRKPTGRLIIFFPCRDPIKKVPKIQ